MNEDQEHIELELRRAITEGRDFIVRGVCTITEADVQGVMRASDVSESEAFQRLAGYVLDRVRVME